MPSTDEHDWIFDFVLQFLESDKFDAAVMDFVDEKCFVFENEEENKFEYTDIHKEFRDHIEALISSNLGELGITSETFFESCEKGRNNRDINKQVFERMIAMEDFETFKKLMTKRNMELQLETIRSYNTTRNALRDDLNYADDDQEMQDALEASLLTGECERSELPVPEELRVLMESHSSNHDDKQGPIGEAEMQEILRRSLMEMEMLHRQAELEQADLEQAVALSLALEEERLRIQVVEAKGSSESLSHVGAGDKHSDTKEHRRESASAKSDDKLSVGGSAKEAHSSSSSTSMSPRQERSHDTLSQQAGSRITQSALVASDVAEEKSRFTQGIEDDDGESSRRQKAGPRPVIRGDGMADYAAPKPLHGRHLGYGALGAIPAMGTSSNALEDKRKEAAEEIRKGQEQLSEQRKQEDKLRNAVGHVDPVEAEKRRKHMAEQRDRLISMKKTERDKKVKEEEERAAKLGAGTSDTLPAGVLKSKGQAQAAAQAEAKGGDAVAGIDEKKRSAMRLALARRMKLDLIEGEEQKLAQLQEDQFADLDRKLQQVERLRRDNKEREIVLAQQVLRQQENIARNVQESAHDLRGRRS